MWVKNVDVQGYYLYLEQINLSVNTEYWFKKKKFEITDIYKFSFPKWSYIYAYKKLPILWLPNPSAKINNTSIFL